MSELFAGGPAFPVMFRKERPDGTWGIDPESAGMSLRDYFAAAALSKVSQISRHGEFAFTPEKAADLAYEVADSMIKRGATAPVSPDPLQQTYILTLEKAAKEMFEALVAIQGALNAALPNPGDGPRTAGNIANYAIGRAKEMGVGQ